MKIILFANTDWYLYNFRLPLAQALMERGDSVLLISPAGPYAERLLASGFRWKEFAVERKGKNPITDGLVILRLWNLYHREHPHLVHHFTVKCVLYGSIAARMAGIPMTVNSITGLGFAFTGSNKWLKKMIAGLYRLLLHKTWVIFQNPDDKLDFEKMGLVAAERVKLIRGSGVDTRHFRPTTEPEGVPVILLPARLIWDKGIGEFIGAARILKQRGINARFVLVGDIDKGNPSAIPFRVVADWQKQNLIEWWGWQENMVSVYHQANIICLPSYREGIPKTLIEAAACGRAIVTTDVPGCREIVHHEKNGLLVPLKDINALANALQTLIEQPALRAKMANIGRQMAVKDFDVVQIVYSTLEFYSHIKNLTWGVQ